MMALESLTLIIYNVLQCKTHQDNYSECSLHSVNKIFLHTNILLKFQHAQAKNAVFSFNKISLQFGLVTQFLTLFDHDLDIISINILTKFQAAVAKKSGFQRVNKIVFKFGIATQFLNQCDPYSNLTSISLRQTF